MALIVKLSLRVWTSAVLLIFSKNAKPEGY